MKEEAMKDNKLWYEKQSRLGEAFHRFYRTCTEESVLDKKTLELLQLALACVFRCPHCTESHIKKALEAGATKQEISETLLIAAVEGAGTQLYWQKPMFEKYLGKVDPARMHAVA